MTTEAHTQLQTFNVWCAMHGVSFANGHLPQQNAEPSVLSAHVCPAPAATAVALTPPKLTGRGTLDGAPQHVPCPRAASILLPQHHTVLDLIAHMCALPALAYVTPLDIFMTGVGTYLSMNVPSPSWPYALLPQHDRAPGVTIAQEK